MKGQVWQRLPVQKPGGVQATLLANSIKRDKDKLAQTLDAMAGIGEVVVVVHSSCVLPDVCVLNLVPPQRSPRLAGQSAENLTCVGRPAGHAGGARAVAARSDTSAHKASHGPPREWNPV
jgi:hypothetical protein